MVLVNAVYFKGQWKLKFDANNTHNKPFHVDEKTVKEVPTMFKNGKLIYGELPNLKAKFVEIPYKVKRFLAKFRSKGKKTPF